MSALHPKVLVIDGDPQMYRYLHSAMTSVGYGADSSTSGTRGLERVVAHPPDAVVLDLDIADMDGKALLREMRANFYGPILALSTLNRQIETIDALDLGADDFVVKPFGAGELLARLRALFRRRILSSGGKPIVKAQGLSVDLVRRIVMLHGSPVTLSEQQYWVLARLAESGGGVLTHWDLLVGNQTDAGVKSLQNMRVLIRTLREKVESNPRSPQIIQTQHTIGYRLNVDHGFGK